MTGCGHSSATWVHKDPSVCFRLSIVDSSTWVCAATALQSWSSPSNHTSEVKSVCDLHSWELVQILTILSQSASTMTRMSPYFISCFDPSFTDTAIQDVLGKFYSLIRSSLGVIESFIFSTQSATALVLDSTWRTAHHKMVLSLSFLVRTKPLLSPTFSAPSRWRNRLRTALVT